MSHLPTAKQQGPDIQSREPVQVQLTWTHACPENCIVSWPCFHSVGSNPVSALHGPATRMLSSGALESPGSHKNIFTMCDKGQNERAWPTLGGNSLAMHSLLPLSGQYLWCSLKHTCTL